MKPSVIVVVREAGSVKAQGTITPVYQIVKHLNLK
jgi:hypothetical protein